MPKSANDPIASLASDQFSLGNCKVLQYYPALPATAHLFPDDFLSQLYARMKSARILERAFCGMLDLSHNAVVSYLSNKPLFVLVEWSPHGSANISDFRILGFSFIVTWIGAVPSVPGQRSAFGAYALFPDAWGCPEGEILGMLGLSRMFHTFGLQSMYGQRYIKNALTGKFMSRFGFKDIATLPDFLMRRNGNDIQLVECVVSRLDRRDLADYVSRQLSTLEPETTEGD